MKMPECKSCEYPNLCLCFREAEDYLIPNGELRQIVGCNEIEYIFGEILTDEDILKIGEELRQEGKGEVNHAV
jgi:hypothetical protein